MQIPRLEIEQHMAHIGIDVQNAQIHVEMPDLSMAVNSQPQEMTISREGGSVALDLDAFKSNIGLKNYDELIDDAAAKAFGKAAAATRDIVNTAAFVGDPAIRGQNKVGTAAKNRMLDYQETDTGHGAVPAGIGMKGDPGSLEISWSGGDFSIEFDGGGLADIYVEPPYSVEVYLEERPYIRVSLSEEGIPPVAGRRVSLQA